MGFFPFFFSEYVCRLIKKLRKHLTMGGRKYSYNVTSFIVIGNTEAVGAEADSLGYSMKKREENFHVDTSIFFPSEIIKQSHQQRLRGQE